MQDLLIWLVRLAADLSQVLDCVVYDRAYLTASLRVRFEDSNIASCVLVLREVPEHGLAKTTLDSVDLVITSHHQRIRMRPCY